MNSPEKRRKNRCRKSGRAGRYRDGTVGGIYSDGILRWLNRAIYRQFSITIVSAMALSVLVALILTPRYVQHC
ncbi:hypothetical protein DMH20_16705 [Escherichia coli]|nr:hypothetical protein [Escherichia coli]